MPRSFRTLDAGDNNLPILCPGHRAVVPTLSKPILYISGSPAPEVPTPAVAFNAFSRPTSKTAPPECRGRWHVRSNVTGYGCYVSYNTGKERRVCSLALCCSDGWKVKGTYGVSAPVWSRARNQKPGKTKTSIMDLFSVKPSKASHASCIKTMR